MNIIKVVGVTLIIGLLLMLSGVGAIAGIPIMMICIAGRNLFLKEEKNKLLWGD